MMFKSNEQKISKKGVCFLTPPFVFPMFSRRFFSGKSEAEDRYRSSFSTQVRFLHNSRVFRRRNSVFVIEIFAAMPRRRKEPEAQVPPPAPAAPSR
jgi:hypothetical protein